MSELSFLNNPGPMRYEALAADGVVGKAYWVDAPETDQPERIFFHTEVDDAYEGQGVASQLVRFALDDAIEHGFRIVPVCPYVKSWLQKHEDYAPHAIAINPRHLEAVRLRQHGSD